MEPTIEELMATYAAKYPSNVRDLAETFCVATTRFGDREDIISRVDREGLRRSAVKRGVDPDVLTAAVADYSAIERQAEVMQRARGKPRGAA